MIKSRLVILLSGILLLAAATHIFAQGETPSLLFENARVLGNEGKEQSLRTAVYLLEKIRQDFPEWNDQTVERTLTDCRGKLRKIAPPVPIGTPSREFPVTCFFHPFTADKKFETEDGEIYEINLRGEDRHQLVLVYRKLKDHSRSARICVQLRNTKSITLLLDQKNPGLFSAQTGEYPLSLDLPSRSLLYLVRISDDPKADPLILSNIVPLP